MVWSQTQQVFMFIQKLAFFIFKDYFFMFVDHQSVYFSWQLWLQQNNKIFRRKISIIDKLIQRIERYNSEAAMAFFVQDNSNKESIYSMAQLHFENLESSFKATILGVASFASKKNMRDVVVQNTPRPSFVKMNFDGG